MSGYKTMIAKDLELLWSIQEYFRRTPWLDSAMSRIVSKYPLQDIGVIVWCFFMIGVIEIGRPYFWTTAMNLIFAVGEYKAIKLIHIIYFTFDLVIPFSQMTVGISLTELNCERIL